MKLNMHDPETPLRALHDLYCKLTGRNLKYAFYQREWSDFAQNFTTEDLQAVMAYVDRENRKREKRFQIRTELLRLIGDLAVFDSLRAEADLYNRAQAAKRRQVLPTTGERALADMRHEPEPVKDGEPAKRLSLDFVANSLRNGKG